MDGFSSEGKGTLAHITFQRETVLACQWGEFPSFAKVEFLRVMMFGLD